MSRLLLCLLAGFFLLATVNEADAARRKTTVIVKAPGTTVIVKR